ncbi:hypothetical protein OK016_20655 [Vibrio chagasii]|nr:hypothetical protein [Vibrio chagasii]
MFWVELLEGGWTVGSAPTLSRHDWNKEQAEIPKRILARKQRCSTVVLGSLVLKLITISRKMKRLPGLHVEL